MDRQKRWNDACPVAWAWQLEEGVLCRWASPTRAMLEKRGKPSPGATATRVRLVTLSDFLELTR